MGENLAALAAGLPHLADVVRRETGRASIGFPSVDAMTAFLGALANAGPRHGFYERMAHWASPDAWQLVVGLKDPGLDRDPAQVSSDRGPDHDGDLAPDGTPRSRLRAASFQVRFPRSDIDEMTERMRRHNRGEAVPLGRPTWAAISLRDDDA